MENVKVALWGFGAMGSGIAKVLLRKKGVDIVGVCDIHPARAGRSIYELLEIDRGSRDDVLVNPKIEEVVHDGNCDICVIATDSFTRKAFNKIKFVVEQNVNVVSTAEEMSFPMAQEPELSAEMDKLAKEHGVSILGTGINPGLMMDLLAICLSGCMTRSPAAGSTACLPSVPPLWKSRVSVSALTTSTQVLKTELLRVTSALRNPSA